MKIVARNRKEALRLSKDPRTIHKCGNLLKIKNPQGLNDPEDCTRSFILTRSPAPEGSKVVNSAPTRPMTCVAKFSARVGLLASGVLTYFPRLPIRKQ